MAISLLLMNHK